MHLRARSPPPAHTARGLVAHRFNVDAVGRTERAHEAPDQLCFGAVVVAGHNGAATTANPARGGRIRVQLARGPCQHMQRHFLGIVAQRAHLGRALRQHHRDERARAKAEKAFLAPSKLKPEFWEYYPNHDGRRDTLAAVLKSMDMRVEKLDDLMPAYAKWLLTAKKTHANGRPMNRWALMEVFATERHFA